MFYVANPWALGNQNGLLATNSPRHGQRRPSYSGISNPPISAGYGLNGMHWSKKYPLNAENVRGQTLGRNRRQHGKRTSVVGVASGFWSHGTTCLSV
eukprot:scaffold1936_cov362-Pinguiococcus_pyrenoidosus.AAC.2